MGGVPDMAHSLEELSTNFRFNDMQSMQTNTLCKMQIFGNISYSVFNNMITYVLKNIGVILISK